MPKKAVKINEKNLEEDLEDSEDLVQSKKIDPKIIHEKVSVSNDDSNNNDTLGDIFDSVESEDPQAKIVSELLSEENLDRKTELNKPLRWSALAIIKQKFAGCQMKVCESILDEFIDKSFKYLISKDRKGRMEYVQALQSFSMSVKETETNKLKDFMK